MRSVARHGAASSPRVQVRGPSMGLALQRKHMQGVDVDVGKWHAWEKDSQSPLTPIIANRQPLARTRLASLKLLPLQSSGGMTPTSKALNAQANRRNSACRVSWPISLFFTTVKTCRVSLVLPMPNNDDQEIVKRPSTFVVGAPSPCEVQGMLFCMLIKSTFFS